MPYAISSTTTASRRLIWLDEIYRGQPLLAAVGVLLLLMMVPSVAALALDTRTLNGISVWIKPLKFQASLATQLFTVAWAMRFLPEARRNGAFVRVLSALLAGAALFEVGYISHQASLGEASHYNVGTAYTRFMYAMMGVGSLILIGTTGLVGSLILRHGDRRDPMALAAGLGLVFGGVLGGITGALLSIHRGHWVGGEASDIGGLLVFGWSRTGGDLRVAHFIGLHMMQALPITALIARRLMSGERCRRTIMAAAVLGSGATIAALVQARSGLPLVPA